MSFEQVSARAIEYAEQGFMPAHGNAIEKNLTFFKGWARQPGLLVETGRLHTDWRNHQAAHAAP